MSRTLLILLACTTCACATAEYVADGGSEVDASGPMGQLELESASSLALVFGEASEIVVRYTEQGAPVAGAMVRFAMEGRAHDATVGELIVATDRDGRARTRLTAGSTAAVFRVRIAADRAAPVYVNVAVGNMGFGGLRVRAAYAGRRGVVKRVVEVHADVTCEDEPPLMPDRSVAIEDPTDEEARFRVLPAGLRYRVTGRALGPTGIELASACIDDVGIVREEETQVSLELVDAPLVPGGRYEVVLDVATATSAGIAAELALAAATARIESSGSVAGLYLDALEAELADRGETAAAAALAAERFDGGPDSTLTASLAEAAIDLIALLDERTAVLADHLSSVGVRGPMSIAADAGELSVSWMPTRLVLGGDPTSPPVTIAGELIGLELVPPIAASWRPEADTIDLASLRLTLPLGSLAARVLEALAVAAGHSSLGELLAEGAGCDVLAAWAAESSIVAPVCGPECAQQACMRALDAVMEDVATGLVEADASRATIVVAGAVSAIDLDADRAVDQLGGAMLGGVWIGPLDEHGDTIVASLTAQRSAE